MRSHEETDMRLPGLRLVVVLGGLVASIGWAQRVRGGLELWIGIPVRSESDSVEVAYSINAGQSHTYHHVEGQADVWECGYEAVCDRGGGKPDCSR